MKVPGKPRARAPQSDLARRKRAEAALRESEARFHDFARASGDWFWETDAQGRFTWVSDTVETVTGVTPAWHYGKTRSDIAAEGQDFAVEPWKSHLEAVARRQPFRDFRYLRQSPGGRYWMSTSGVPRFDAENRFLGYRGVSSQINDQVLAEQRARVANERLKAAITHLDEGFALWDRENRLVMWNPKFEQLSAVPHLLAEGVHDLSLLRAAAGSGRIAEAVGREEDWVAERADARRNPRGPQEICRGGRWHEVDSQRLPDGATITLIIDVHERRKAEEALRASEARFQALFQESKVAQFVGNPETRRIEAINRAALELTGRAQEEIIDRTGWDAGFVERSDVEAARAQMVGGGSLTDFPSRIRRPDGSTRSVLLSAHFVRIAGQPKVLWSAFDITEREKAQEELRASDARFSALFRDSPAPQSVLDVQTYRYLNVNPSWCDLTGYAASEVIGRDAREFALFEPAWRERTTATLARDGFVDRHEVRMHRRDGSERTILLSGRLIEVGGRTLKIWWLIDVTAERAALQQVERLNASLEHTVDLRTAELKRANDELQGVLDNLKNSQDRLVHSEKLAALGRLVAGIAHELNTPIGNSLLSATTLDEHTGAFADAAASGSLRRSALEAFVAQSREASGILTRNLAKAAELIRSFKQVAADQTSSQRRDFSLGEVAREVLLAHRPMLKTSPITVELDVPAGIRMDSYPGPLGQVLGNLVTNAVLHAYEGETRGEVVVSARLDGDGWVEIAVRDHGRGIGETDLKRIFDPFFTTKLGRGGTGLGLGICHNIVTGTLGGEIRVASRAGEGSSFILRVPLRVPVVIGQQAA